MAMTLAVFTALPSFAAPGDLDSPFGAQGKVTEVDSSANDVLVQGDKIVVAADDQVNRYTTTGARDSTFGGGDGSVGVPPGAERSARSIALQADGELVTAGYAINALGEVHFEVTRYTKKGLVDPTFGPGGFVTSDFLGVADAVAIQPDGKIVAAGSRVTPLCCPHVRELVVVRYMPDGKLDPSFNGDGVQSTLMPVGSTYGDVSAAATAIVIQPNGKITVAGIRRSQVSPNEDVVVVRYDTAGNLDPVWGGTGMVITDLGSMEQGTGIAQQPDGKLIVSGTKGHPDDDGEDIVPEDMLVLRYNSDGTLDSSFGSGGSTTIDFGAAESANDLAVQADGKIVVVGKKTHEDFALARLNPDGSHDSGFGVGGKVTTDFGLGYFGGYAHAVALQPDGKIVAVGTVFRQTSASSSDSYLVIARYLAAGASPPCNITGTSGDDVLTGSEYADVICAGDGNDIIRAGGGNDVILAGNGNDAVFGEGGDDTIYGGIGNDILNGDSGLDTVYGGDGNDQINGGPHRDAMYGEAGADRIAGGGGPDYFSGGAGADILEGQDAQPDDSLDGGAAVDTCASDPGDTVTGCP